MHDLLAAAVSSWRHLHARAAISAYREAVPGYRASAARARGQMRAVQSLVRALDLAFSMNQRDLRGPVVQDMLDLADDRD